jgi:hypothetical protein
MARSERGWGVPQETLPGARTRSFRLRCADAAARGSSVTAIAKNSGLSSTAPGAGRGQAVGGEPFFFASFLTCSTSSAIRVARKLKAIDMIDVLPDLFILRGVSAHMQLVDVLENGALHIGARFVVRTSSILN